jgi:hypothetical protein
MDFDDFSGLAKAETMISALTCIIMTMLLKHLEDEQDIDRAARETLDTALGIAGNMRLIGGANDEHKAVTRSAMDGIITDYVMAAAAAAKRRRNKAP